MTRTWTGSSRGVDWTIELERDRLLPGRLTPGRVTVRARDGFEGRSLVVALRAEEHWQFEQSRTDGQGHTTTQTVTSRNELVHEPVELEAPVRLAAGEERSFDLQLPVPPLGPATLAATVAGVDWTVDAKIDVPGGLDSGLAFPVQVVQPVALLRAGVVHVGEFALYPAADSGDTDLSASVTLDPLPLATGAPFHGEIRLHSTAARRLQEIRAEIRVHVKATVSSGKSQTITAWAGQISGPTEISGDAAFTFASTLADVPLPTIELPHGTAAAEFHVILATAWARDPHLVRDITIATTLEL
jgi:hypothetical protein